MNLESAVKFFAPKTPALSDAPGATGERLAISDVMASFGLTEAQARFGFELFLSKHGITTSDRAVSMLTDYGMGQAARYRAIASLSEPVRSSLIQLLATFAYQDYTRSAASTRPCSCCSGTGFIEAEVFSTKAHTPPAAQEILRTSLKWGVKIIPSEYEVKREVREIQRVLCKSCGGKGVISNACRCHGKGVVLDEEQSKLQGVPVTKTCPKCSGRGYARLPGEAVRRAICLTVMRLSEPGWRRHFKPLYEALIMQCHKEEALADSMLRKVTR
ncbi:antitermination protein [Pantoea sp. Bo_2]|uniref:antitermination protein Q n=1 Tax=unclassified Pantoea TaxID=2630326 RepID=UPI001231DFFE|nr:MULTISPECIES: antitermination protein [unclassified Pantoea]KAA5936448.1 antitermination protein [Pantoea sp. VH_3]KAA5949688.1 antitermination protein [Pantoea sp. VH_25]KAA5955415.1 antitermination protein [Pantoea sp. VH_24]KAA5958964.1 antitermination protein [Pantoea sp. VH_16]KAA5964162.1 antitermination protein [Pantoea sp. VH_18]